MSGQPSPPTAVACRSIIDSRPRRAYAWCEHFAMRCTNRSCRWQHNSSDPITGAECSRCCEPFSIYRTALKVHDVVNPDSYIIRSFEGGPKHKATTRKEP